MTKMITQSNIVSVKWSGVLDDTEEENALT